MSHAQRIMRTLDTPTHTERLETLYRSLATAVSADDVRAYEVEDLVAHVAQPLSGTLSEVIELLEDLEAELEAASRDPGSSDALDFDFSFEMTPAPGELAPSQVFATGLPAHAANICFAARGELRRVHRDLDRTGASYDALLGACESARRKIRRSIGAVLDAVAHISGEPSPVGDDRSSELESAIAIRSMYGKFRRQLIDCDEDDLDAVCRALRYAAVAIAKMVGAPEFAEVRLTDRNLLLSLQGRILCWARGPRGRDGVQLFKDICTAADLLSAISMRQELQENDRNVIAEVGAVLVGAPQAAAYRETLTRLTDLHGRDDQLDDLVAELRVDGFRDVGWRRLAVMVRRISDELNATAASHFS